MSSLLQSTKNTRVLPTGTDRYYRSDFPENLADEEIRWLSAHEITTIVDLRDRKSVV